MDFEENAISIKHLGIFQTRPEELVLVHRENVSNEPHHDHLQSYILGEGAYILPPSDRHEGMHSSHLIEKVARIETQL